MTAARSSTFRMGQMPHLAEHIRERFESRRAQSQSRCIFPSTGSGRSSLSPATADGASSPLASGHSIESSAHSLGEFNMVW
jgi:hypothetical protein